MFTKQSIVKKTFQVGSLTFLSRLLGLAREVLMGHYLGAGVVSDAFFTAFKIPNSLRKIFAEGALSAAFIPTFVQLIKKNGKKEINQLMTLALLLFESVLIGLCLFVFWKADLVIRFIVPGWYETALPTGSITGISFIDSLVNHFAAVFWSTGSPIAQVAYAVLFLRILIFFILFLSICALLAGALQSVHHFYVPAFGPVLLNIVFISGIAICMAKGLSVSWLCGFIMIGAFLQLIMHMVVYRRLGFSLGTIDSNTWKNMKRVFEKFFPCLLAMSIMEIQLFLSMSLGSYLPTGSISLIYYANRFMQIPLGVFAIALSTVLLPFFSRLGIKAKKRLNFYLFETTKLVVWVTVPISLLMGFVSEKIFYTLFLSRKFNLAQVQEAGSILVVFLLGLCFFSLNKILLNLYYALDDTKTPMYITIVTTTAYFILSCYVFMPLWGACGIALGTVVSGMITTTLFLSLLHRKFGLLFYGKRLVSFFLRMFLQLLFAVGVFLVLYYGIVFCIEFLPAKAVYFLQNTILYWAWVGPLAGIMWLVFSKTRNFFGIEIYFLD